MNFDDTEVQLSTYQRPSLSKSANLIGIQTIKNLITSKGDLKASY